LKIKIWKTEINIYKQNQKLLENVYNSNVNEKEKVINQINNSLFQKEKEIQNKYDLILAENNNKIPEIQTALLQKDHEIDL
jgi:hypothetical protein